MRSTNHGLQSKRQCLHSNNKALRQTGIGLNQYIVQTILQQSTSHCKNPCCEEAWAKKIEQFVVIFGKHFKGY